MRLEGKSFETIGTELSLSERQIRRHYVEFLQANNEVFKYKKKHIFGEITFQLKHSLDEANKSLAEAKKSNDLQKTFFWFKIRQEALHDYLALLKHLNFSLNWTDDYDPDPFAILTRDRGKDKILEDEDALL